MKYGIDTIIVLTDRMLSLCKPLGPGSGRRSCVCVCVGGGVGGMEAVFREGMSVKWEVVFSGGMGDKSDKEISRNLSCLRYG